MCNAFSRLLNNLLIFYIGCLYTVITGKLYNHDTKETSKQDTHDLESTHEGEEETTVELDEISDNIYIVAKKPEIFIRKNLKKVHGYKELVFKRTNGKFTLVKTSKENKIAHTIEENYPLSISNKTVREMFSDEELSLEESGYPLKALSTYDGSCKREENYTVPENNKTVFSEEEIAEGLHNNTEAKTTDLLKRGIGLFCAIDRILTGMKKKRTEALEKHEYLKNSTPKHEQNIIQSNNKSNVARDYVNQLLKPTQSQDCTHQRKKNLKTYIDGLIMKDDDDVCGISKEEIRGGSQEDNDALDFIDMMDNCLENIVQVWDLIEEKTIGKNNDKNDSSGAIKSTLSKLNESQK